MCLATFASMQVLPEPALPAGSWPNNLVVGYVGGYTYEVRPSHMTLEGALISKT